MDILVLTLHVISIMLVIGTLFVNSLLVVFRLRLSNQAQIKGVKSVQSRAHQSIYYPILIVAVATGIYIALLQERFSNPDKGWLHTKYTLLLILIFLGIVNGRQITNSDLRKSQALMVHIVNVFRLCCDDFSGRVQTILKYFQILSGEVSEWFKVIDSKSIVRSAYRGFESLPLRHT